MTSTVKAFRSAAPTMSSVGDRNNSSFVLADSTEGPVYANFGNDNGSTTYYGKTDHGKVVAERQRGFSPYDFNGGTVAAVAGPDYCVIAADTRLSTGYEILSRNCTKLHSLNASCVLASSGCKTDVDQLRSWLDIKMKVR